jgi:predicted alpha/beta-fold hydrolase
MRQKARLKWAQYPGLFDLEQALQATTLEAFDDAFTAPLHGFKGVMDYWTRASAKPVLPHIKVPTLLLNALNDPFVPSWSLPNTSQVGTWVENHQSKQGGHVGFCQSNAQVGWRTSVMEMPRAVCAWLAQASSTHRGQDSSVPEVAYG